MYHHAIKFCNRVCEKQTYHTSPVSQSVSKSQSPSQSPRGKFLDGRPLSPFIQRVLAVARTAQKSTFRNPVPEQPGTFSLPNLWRGRCVDEKTLVRLHNYQPKQEINQIEAISMNTITYLWKQTKSPSQWESLSQSPWQFGSGFGGAPRSLKVCWSAGSCSSRWIPAVVLSAAPLMLPPKKVVDRSRMALRLMIIVVAWCTLFFMPLHSVQSHAKSCLRDC